MVKYIISGEKCGIEEEQLEQSILNENAPLVEKQRKVLLEVLQLYYHDDKSFKKDEFKETYENVAKCMGLQQTKLKDLAFDFFIET